MSRKGIGCVGVAGLFVAAGLGFCAWVLTTEFGDVARGELKSRSFERRLQGDGVDHPAVWNACLPLLGLVGTNGVLVLKDHNTPPDARVPETVRALSPDRILVTPRRVDLSWNVQMGVCGLLYCAAEVDLAREVAAIERTFRPADHAEQTVIPVADHVIFYRYRLDILGF